MNELEQNKINSPHPIDDEIDINFSELFDIVWKGKKLIILVTSIFLACTVFYSSFLSNYYLSQSILTGKESQSSGNLSKFSGLASVAGVSLPSSGNNAVAEVMEIIRSREFVKHLLTFENILPSIMAAKNYDVDSDKLYFDPKIYDVETKTWTKDLDSDLSNKPSYLEVHEVYTDELLLLSQSKATNFVTISIEHISPVFAKEFLELIIREANNLKRKKDIETSSKALNFLKIELSQTKFVEVRESINQLIRTQLETQMMAKINDEYSLVIIDPPFIPEEISKPGRVFIWFFGAMIGGLLSLLIVFVQHYRSDKEVINKSEIIK